MNYAHRPAMENSRGKVNDEESNMSSDDSLTDMFETVLNRGG